MLTILSTKSSQVPVITKVGAVFVWCADSQPETTGMSDDNFLNEYEPGPVDQRRAKRGGRKKRTKKPMAGYIFCCNNVTEEECLQRGLFGGPSERNEHEEIVPCMPLFLYNTDDRQLSGPFMAESSIQYNPKSKAWQGQFPYQVKWSKNKGWKKGVKYAPIPEQPTQGLGMRGSFFPQGKVTKARYLRLLELLGVESHRLDVGTLREAAAEAGLTERLYNTHSYVIGFEGATEDGYCKYDIYYTTGNVKTCIDHPNQGKTQRFRVPCDMGMVTELFTHPRLHTHIGY